MGWVFFDVGTECLNITISFGFQGLKKVLLQNPWSINDMNVASNNKIKYGNASVPIRLRARI
jgi:hypothetical protein